MSPCESTLLAANIVPVSMVGYLEDGTPKRTRVT